MSSTLPIEEGAESTTSSLLPLPLGNADFRMIRLRKLTYIDKTHFIYSLMQSGGQAFFLSRPRRFGKSLFLDTLSHFFSGHRELFKGLWIENKGGQEVYPVLRLDLSIKAIIAPKAIERYLCRTFLRIAKEWGLSLTSTDDYAILLEELIYETYQKRGPVVILIDEYDSFINEFLHIPSKAQKLINTFRPLFATLKSCQNYIRFLFVTGVTRYASLNFFSAINHLIDISFDSKFSTILGFTEEEIRQNLSVWLQYVAERRKVTLEVIWEELRNWYNGYIWEGEPVYNPFSLLHYLEHAKAKDYWFSAGASPQLIINLLRTYKYDLSSIEHVPISQAELNSTDIEYPNLPSLLLQTGYLTFSGKELVDEMGNTFYYLRLPNHEVRSAFKEHLLKTYFPLQKGNSYLSTSLLLNALKTGDTETFLNFWNTVWAKLPYNLHLPYESYYHSL
ncbi:MAG: AAA family ATPase, partial [Bacteroidia bacterium]|nr:AAA family ATPase [Bacteroidia bacterium]